MKKKTSKQTGKVLFYLAICSCLITLVEGVLYYSAEAHLNPLFRWMLIIQNTINAFAFKSNIGISKVADIIRESENVVEIVVGYMYSVAMFVAPYCTVAYIYKVIERLLRIRHWNGWLHKNKEKCLIFGYNDEVKALLSDADTAKYRIHLVDEKISEEEELQLLKKGIIVHRVDLLKIPKDELYFLKQMELKEAKTIVLFDNSSAKNFSLYRMFHDETVFKLIKRDDIKFFCRCEDPGIQSILEDYHDADVTKRMDIEIISIPELRVRQLLSGNRLHNYYLSKYDGQIPLEETKNWHFHMLIVGFGKIGQQLLLQSMNQGVVSSENDIIIDVVDFNIDEKKSIFANYFNDEYVEISENEILIPQRKADGRLLVRFHKMDIRFQEFQKILREYGDTAKGEIFTFIAICLKDTDISLHCLTQVQQYLRKYDKANRVSVAVRMEYDKKMAKYLNEDNKSYTNVFAIEDTESTITLELLLHDTIDKNAKEFNRIYDGNASDVNEAWKKLKLVRRNSNRALAYHQEIKEILLQGKEKPTFDINDSFSEEFAKMEHRRWCYYMASCGWKRTDNPTADKCDELKENPCLCNWADLVKYKPDTCEYDLMPLILYYEMNQK